MGTGISAGQWGSNIIISEKRHNGRYKNDNQTIFFWEKTSVPIVLLYRFIRFPAAFFQRMINFPSRYACFLSCFSFHIVSFQIFPVLGDGVKRFFRESKAVSDASRPQNPKKISISILSFFQEMTTGSLEIKSFFPNFSKNKGEERSSPQRRIIVYPHNTSLPFSRFCAALFQRISKFLGRMCFFSSCLYWYIQFYHLP